MRERSEPEKEGKAKPVGTPKQDTAREHRAATGRRGTACHLLAPFIGQHSPPGTPMCPLPLSLRAIPVGPLGETWAESCGGRIGFRGDLHPQPQGGP